MDLQFFLSSLAYILLYRNNWMLRPCQRLVIHSYNVTFNALGQAFENPFSKLLCLKFYITAWNRNICRQCKCAVLCWSLYIQQSNSVCRIHCKGLVTSSQFFFTSFGICRKFVSLNEVFTVTDIKLIKETSIITIQYGSVEAPCGLRYA